MAISQGAAVYNNFQISVILDFFLQATYNVISGWVPTAHFWRLYSAAPLGGCPNVLKFCLRFVVFDGGIRTHGVSHRKLHNAYRTTHNARRTRICLAAYHTSYDAYRIARNACQTSPVGCALCTS